MRERKKKKLSKNKFIYICYTCGTAAAINHLIKIQIQKSPSSSYFYTETRCGGDKPNVSFECEVGGFDPRLKSKQTRKQTYNYAKMSGDLSALLSFLIYFSHHLSEKGLLFVTLEVGFVNY